MPMSSPPWCRLWCRLVGLERRFFNTLARTLEVMKFERCAVQVNGDFRNVYARRFNGVLVHAYAWETCFP